jgi:DNA-binding transcriptional MocR family regulator
MALAAFLADGGYERTLQRLRGTYRELSSRMAAAIARDFPPGTRVSRPGGGHVLWVEMPEEVDAVVLHEAALQEGVSIAPGILFSATGRYRNCVRLNCALPWDERLESALQRLGSLAGSQL